LKAGWSRGIRILTSWGKTKRKKEREKKERKKERKKGGGETLKEDGAAKYGYVRHWIRPKYCHCSVGLFYQYKKS